MASAMATRVLRLVLRRQSQPSIQAGVITYHLLLLHAVTPVLGVVDLERLASALGSLES